MNIGTVFNNLVWEIGKEPLISNINLLSSPISHPIPLNLYFLNGDYYEVRQYNRQLTGLEILGAIQTYWNEIIPQSQLGKLYDYCLVNVYGGHYNELVHKLRRILNNNSGETVTKHELPLGEHIYFQGLEPYQNGYIVNYGKL